jgi:hypothetical protein
MAGRTYIKYLKEFEADMVRALKPLGHKAMLHAYHTGHTDEPRGTTEITKKGDYKWRHRLGNLHDSFASAIFVNGVLSSVTHISNPISKKRDSKTKKGGRKVVDEYLRNASFGEKNMEIVLVVVAAMYYARYLEDADTGSGKFIVITPAREYINQNWWEYVAPVYKKYGLPMHKPKSRVVKGVKAK